MNILAQAPAAAFGLEALTAQAKTVFIFILVGLACYALYLGTKGNIGKVTTVLIIILLAMIPLGIAASGPDGIMGLAGKLANFITG